LVVMGNCSELAITTVLNVPVMPRKKIENPEERLTHNLIIRVNEAVYKRLENMQQNSSYGTIAEVARKILSNEKLNLFYTDISMNAPMEEMALIRKEIKAIGHNINQQTKHFHTSRNEAERAFYVMKTAQLYQSIEAKVEKLLILISKLAEKWLQR
jgi:trimethylamine:corrinoid methyltransferase-like protein